MNKLIRVAALSLLAAGCSKQSDQQAPARNIDNPARNEPLPYIPPPGTGPNSRTPFAAPPQQKPTIDPKSTEAAVELVQRFADLLNQGKLNEAYMLLGASAPTRNEFDGKWQQINLLNVKVGTPGEQEGAAGSIYVSIPLLVSGVAHGEGFHQTPTAILRRVNDVPGSTEAQRHWHIERIDWERGD